jgi:selenocysteine lyase/cysteine desulfurase
MRQRYLDFVKKQIIGNDLLFETPYGLRNMFYADYTASGRGLCFIEEKLLRIQKSYANTHTEDDYSGKYLTGLYHQAETRIKRLVNAGEHGKIFPVGSGSTGALKKLQEIIGVYIPPLTKERLGRAVRAPSPRYRQGDLGPLPPADRSGISRDQAGLGAHQHPRYL